MKLVRYPEGGAARFAWVEGDRLFECLGDPLENRGRGSFVRGLADVQLLAPCVPSKVVAMAVNYAGATGQTPDMKEPLAFLKPATSVCGPEADIVCPFGDVQVWGESELAIVIGKRLKTGSRDDARRAIFGYTSANDVSADNLEGRDHHLVRSKGADTFCPLGPWIDTEYEPGNRLVEGWQNGELIRQGNTDRRIWKDVETVWWLSQWMSLEPWDVILTGAPSRVTPKRYLEDGDLYEVKVQGLGTLKNRFRRVPRVA